MMNETVVGVEIGKETVYTDGSKRLFARTS